VRIEDVKVITVIGAGNMGHQIGTLCALHGFETYITDTNSAQLKKRRTSSRRTFLDVWKKDVFLRRQQI
jgi:3-hydroxybutyryl-CoA dehydrogenase